MCARFALANICTATRAHTNTPQTHVSVCDGVLYAHRGSADGLARIKSSKFKRVH